MTHFLLSFPRSLLQGRYRIVASLWAACLVVFTLLRLVLAVSTASGAQWSPLTLLHSFTLGFAYDVGVATVLCIPFGILLALLPRRLVRSPLVKVLAAAVIFAGASALLFDVLAEWLFWDEFSTRFNFIAVDYLVYTNEVLGNIRQSYPVVLMLACIGVLSLLFVWGLRRAIHRACDPLGAEHGRWKAVAAHASLGALLMIVLSGGDREAIANAYAREISGNGLFELIRAFKDNELEYDRFYETMPRQQAHSQSKDERALSGWSPSSGDADDLRMRVTGTGTELRPNVVIICMESMSADYMRTFGYDKNLKPNLDRLAGESMFFSRAFASGTRTVRGLEALALSV
ncbi:MAG: hypothetical protein EXR36_10085, partial [Betaproteobacteria bacterium]|nr:hypothetical protein [Betaproteobacteria bacterium]